MTILVSPILYLFLFRPLNVHIAALRQAQDLLRQQRDHLEEEVRHRTAELVERNREIVDREVHYRAVVEGASEGILTLDEQGLVVRNNMAAEKIFGFAPGKMAGMPLAQMLTPDSAKRCLGSDGLLYPVSDLSLEAQNKNGEIIPVLLSVSAFRHENTRYHTAIIQNISERVMFEKRLARLAYYDSLTGLPNRRLFHDRLGQAIERARRDGKLVGILFLDLDHFKDINDTLGHLFGDLLLQETANRLARTLRQTDFVALSDRNEANYFVARQGGNEFSVLLDGVHRAQDTANVARRILEALARPFDLDGNEIVASACIGIAVYPLDGKDADSLRKGAGSAMHHAKQQGRNGYQYYNAVMNTRALEKLALESHLRKALERDEFALHYQPKVDLENGNIAGAEALLRWISPERGLVPPAQFIPMLEEAGMIVEVGAWALRKAVADHLRWHDQGLPAPRVSVNVSAIQLRQEDFVAVLAHAIKDGAARPGIDLEITESLVMHDIESNIAKLKAVRDLGMDIAIDDFGTGHSSLAYLAKLPLQTLKIDRSFIITMLDNADAATLVRTIISLAHSLRLIVVAEGVETEEQAKMLRLLRCDQMQGYLFSKPLPFEEMTALLKAAAPGERAQGKVNPERARLREAP